MYIAPSCRVVSRMLRLVHSIWTVELNFSSRTHCEQPHWKCTCPELATVEQYEVYRVGQKVGPQTHDQHSLKWILKIPPHLACVATLPCETLMSAKQANDKLQGSVATMYMSLLIIKLRNVYLHVSEKKIKIGEFLGKLPARTWLSHALCAPGQHTAKRRSARDETVTFLLVTFPNICRLKKTQQ